MTSRLARVLVLPVLLAAGVAAAQQASPPQGAAQVRKACAIGQKLRHLGIRRYGVVRIDSAASPAAWAENPRENTRQIKDLDALEWSGRFAHGHLFADRKSNRKGAGARAVSAVDAAVRAALRAGEP